VSGADAVGADDVAACFAVMWMTANDAPLPTRAQVAGVRRQVAALLSAPVPCRLMPRWQMDFPRRTSRMTTIPAAPPPS